nr:nitrous oxide reductase maturation protein [uncultured bacterium]
MQKIIFISILFFYGCLQSVEAKSIDVCPTCNHPTIKSAIAAADNGDEIKIKAGTYKEHSITISKSLDIVGEGEVIVDGENLGTIFTINADHFSIQGLTIINVGQSYTKDFSALLVHKANHFTIKNNIFKNVFFGIMIEKSHHGVIEGNKVSGNGTSESNSGNGVHIWHSSNMVVRNNEVSHLRDGIYFEFVTESMVNDNLSHDNIRYGLHFMFSNNDEYINNAFTNNGAGVAVMFSKFINMKSNTFKDNWGTASYGLLLKEIYDAEIESNNFIRNTIGITAEGSTRVNYKKNNFNNNGWAVRITGACYLNLFTSNNFFDNSFDLSYNGQMNDNKFEGNYWSAYTGYDLDRNGIGDIAFRPVKLFSYIVNQTPETIVLLRSLFVDIINFSEKVSPVFTPDKLTDDKPLMKPWK